MAARVAAGSNFRQHAAIQQQSGELFNLARDDASASNFKNANGRLELKEFAPLDDLYLSDSANENGQMTDRIQELDDNLMRFLYSLDEHNKG